MLIAKERKNVIEVQALVISKCIRYSYCNYEVELWDPLLRKWTWANAQTQVFVLQSLVLSTQPGHITYWQVWYCDFPLNILRHPIKTCFYYFKKNSTELDEKHRTQSRGEDTKMRTEGMGSSVIEYLPDTHKVLSSIKRRGKSWKESGGEGCMHGNNHNQVKSVFAIVFFFLFSFFEMTHEF